MLDTPDDGRPNLGRDVLLALRPVIASFESKRRSERVALAMREIKSGRRPTKTGRPPGRQPTLTAGVLEEADRLHKELGTWPRVARRLHIPATSLRAGVFKQKKGLRTYPAEIGRPEGRS